MSGALITIRNADIVEHLAKGVTTGTTGDTEKVMNKPLTQGVPHSDEKSARLPPNMYTLAILCLHCRELADGRKVDANKLRSIRNAMWSIIIPAEVDAKVLAQCKEPWVRDAIELNFMDDCIKEQLLGKAQDLK
jgi:hypothetical protein